jgi:type III restriction enzyme
VSGPEPKPYQSTAIDAISDALIRLLGSDDSGDRLIRFQAPTGSGKTLTVGYALAKTLDHPSAPPFVGLWLSPGKGNLHKQSARNLSQILEGTSVDVQLLDSRDDIVANSSPSAGTLFVVNWEKLRSERDGEWANKMLREGEKANLFTMLQNVTDDGMDLVVVVDESHLNLDGPQTVKLMKAIREFRPFIQIEASATPTTQLDEEKRSEGLHHSVLIPFKAVEAAEMIRKAVLLNPEFEEVQEKYPDVSLDVQVLNAAWDRTQSLTESLKELGSPVRPLLLIQYPDGASADARAAVVEEFLEGKGLVKGSTYAMYLSGDHSSDLENIAKNTSPYQALIFKQAIATGWDCPRAQVLVQFRDPQSETFQIQTLGRILRSPEQKHYDDDALNVAYVYSDLAGVSVQITSDEPEVSVRDLTIKRGAAYPATGLKLHSVFQPRRREYDYPTTATLTTELAKTLNSKVKKLLPKEPPTRTSASVLTDGSLDFKDLVQGKQSVFEGTTADGYLGEQLAQALYDRVLTSSIGEYKSKEQSRTRIKTALVKWVKEQRPDWEADHIQHLVLSNRQATTEAIEAACRKSMAAEEAKAAADARAKRRTTDDWDIPTSELVASATYEDPKVEGNLNQPSLVPVVRSDPEKRFEKWLGAEHAAGRVQWWWKNGIRNEKYLGVEYELPVPAKDDEFTDEISYPDYLVMDGAGTLWAIEVKDIGDREGSVGAATEAKAKGLDKWAATLNKKRKTKTEMLDLPPVAACVAVPKDDANDGIIVKRGNPKKWTPPTAENHSTGNGWTELVLGGSET